MRIGDREAWLDYCRRQRKDLSDAEFKALIPAFCKVRRRLLRAKRSADRMSHAH